MPDEMTEDRREELLRRVLQFDVEDAIARYEAEAGCCVVEVTLRLNDNDKYAMELKTDSRARPNRPAPPITRMLVINLNR